MDTFAKILREEATALSLAPREELIQQTCELLLGTLYKLGERFFGNCCRRNSFGENESGVDEKFSTQVDRIGMLYR